MKTREFMQLVNNLGYGVSILTLSDGKYRRMRIYDSDDYTIATINDKEILSINTEFRKWNILPKEIQNQLINVFYSYTKTPINERGDFKLENNHITTKEFEEKIKSLGYIVEYENTNIIICKKERLKKLSILTHDDTFITHPIAKVCKENSFKFNTSIGIWYRLSNSEKEELMDLILEYSKTPIEKREPEDKYYVEVLGCNVRGKSYKRGSGRFC